MNEREWFEVQRWIQGDWALVAKYDTPTDAVLHMEGLHQAYPAGPGYRVVRCVVIEARS